MRKMLILIALGLLTATMMSACSSTGAPSNSIHVTMTDFQFSPNTFTVPAGEEISVQITNNGAVTHSFIIMKRGDEIQQHFSDADKQNVYWEATAIPSGETTRATFTAPSVPGQYQVVCGVAGHFEAGMVGKLMVVSGQ